MTEEEQTQLLQEIVPDDITLQSETYEISVPCPMRQILQLKEAELERQQSPHGAMRTSVNDVFLMASSRLLRPPLCWVSLRLQQPMISSFCTTIDNRTAPTNANFGER